MSFPSHLGWPSLSEKIPGSSFLPLFSTETQPHGRPFKRLRMLDCWWRKRPWLVWTSWNSRTGKPCPMATAESIGHWRQLTDGDVCFIKRVDDSDLNILNSKRFRKPCFERVRTGGKEVLVSGLCLGKPMVPRSFNELLGWISQPESLIQGRVRPTANNTSCFCWLLCIETILWVFCTWNFRQPACLTCDLIWFWQVLSIEYTIGCSNNVQKTSRKAEEKKECIKLAFEDLELLACKTWYQTIMMCPDLVDDLLVACGLLSYGNLNS